MFGFSASELRTLQRFRTPAKVQDFLEALPINFEERGDTLRSPRRVLRDRTAHCFEGALLAAAALWVRGERPLIMDLETAEGDDNHVIALYRRFGCWGAITKTNHAVLRYREPVYRNLRELALSFFHEYFLDSGKKTLRAFSDPLDLSRMRFAGWMTAEHDLWEIDRAFDDGFYTPLLSSAHIRALRRADPIEIRAGKLTVWRKTAR